VSAALPATQTSSLANVAPAVTLPAVTPSITTYSNSGSLQVSTLSGMLEIFAPTPVDPAQTADYVLLEPAIADAAVADLLLTLADVTTDADAIAADRQPQPTCTNADAGRSADSDGVLAVELAWSSVSFGGN
jgi:hypothetical protein